MSPLAVGDASSAPRIYNRIFCCEVITPGALRKLIGPYTVRPPFKFCWVRGRVGWHVILVVFAAAFPIFVPGAVAIPIVPCRPLAWHRAITSIQALPTWIFSMHTFGKPMFAEHATSLLWHVCAAGLTILALDADR